MKRTRRRLSEYWDRLLLSRIPPFATFKKVEGEIKEHFGFARWAFKRIILPLAVFYLLASLFLQVRIFAPLFISLLIFLYSNFLPDVGYLVKKTNDKRKEWKWQEKYTLLFFAPVVIYYVIAGRAKPLYSTTDRPLHNFKAAFIYGAFLFVAGMLLWDELLKATMLAIFGFLGFSIHLVVDKNFKIN